MSTLPCVIPEHSWIIDHWGYEYISTWSTTFWNLPLLCHKCAKIRGDSHCKILNPSHFPLLNSPRTPSHSEHAYSRVYLPSSEIIWHMNETRWKWLPLHCYIKQWEGMGEVGLARHEPALLPPCPTIRVFKLQKLSESVIIWSFWFLSSWPGLTKWPKQLGLIIMSYKGEYHCFPPGGVILCQHHLSCRPNNNICKPHIGRKIVRSNFYFHNSVQDLRQSCITTRVRSVMCIEVNIERIYLVKFPSLSYFSLNHILRFGLGLCCLMTPGLSKDIWCHVWPDFSKLTNHQIRHQSLHKVGSQLCDCIWLL